ncbi:MAG: aldehyde dehydrogenase family protein, partial [Bacteroidales bacterium]|nr:aldehyde dehydrogenase family protein [Bacteroidales bacterium]
MKSINPNNNKLIKEYPEHSLNEVKNILQEVDDEWQIWKNTSFSERSYLIKNVAKILRNKSE